MELNLDSFKKIELFGWSLVFFIICFFFGHFFVFVGFAFGVRYIYMKYKRSKLGLLPTEGKTVLITGCDSGFGLSLANRLYLRGFKVFATCLNLKSDGAISLTELKSSRMKVVPLDVTDDAMVAKTLKIVKDDCHQTGLWGLVNNAGQDFLGDAELSTMEQYLQVSNINLFGMVRMSRAFLPLLRQAKGRILNVTSVKGLLAVPHTAPYTITKYGGEAFSEVLRQEVNCFGVKVIIIEPCNFGGITGCLNEAGIKRLSNHLDVMWQEANSDCKQIYGQEHLQKLLEATVKDASTSHPTVEPVMNAFEDALRNVCPHIRYLIPGSNSYFDIYAVLARLSPYLPQTIFEKLRSYFFPYIIFK